MKQLITPISVIFLYCSSPALEAASRSQAPELQLANVYSSNIDLKDFWVSEKLDGIRALWNGEKLITRYGNVISAPVWFTQSLPKTPLDGELWVGRGQFEVVSSIVRKYNPVDSEWRRVKFMVFDLPTSMDNFSNRTAKLKSLVKQTNVRHLEYIQQFRLQSQQQLDRALQGINTIGGEGLMLHKGSALYQSKRTNDLQKVKSYHDAEARVVKYIPGKGKYAGKMGSMLVETRDGTQFKIGTGFTDLERARPPSIGSEITFRSRGKTKNGIPRFASYMRVRDEF